MTTLKGIFPNPKPPRKKNFLYENVKSLRQMEKYNSKEDEVDKLRPKTGPRISNKYQHVAPRVYSSIRGSSAVSSQSDKSKVNKTLSRKSSAPSLVKTGDNKSCDSINSNLCNSNNKFKSREYKSQCNLSSNLVNGVSNLDINREIDKKESRSQGIQTLDANDLDSLYSEGVIRYPSSRSRETEEDKSVSKEDVNLNLDLGRDPSPSRSLNSKQMNSTSPSPGKDKDFVKMNKEKITVAARLAAQLNNGIVPPNYRKGVVPKYILERKEEQQLKIEQAKLEAANSDCPTGHIPLPDNERKETLRLLKKNYQEFVNELNKMPIRSDTLRCQKKKMEIEKQLNKLEEGIKIFSRPKVFVKTDA